MSGERIVFVGTFGLRPKGTLSRRALPLAQALARQGHRVTLLAAPWDWPADAGQRAWIGGVETVQMALRGGPLAILTRLLLAIRQRRPTLVIACKPKGYSGLILWGLWQLRRLGGWRGRLWLDADDWEAGWNARLPYPRRLAQFFAWQERWCLTHADLVSAASRWLTTYAAGLRGAATGVIHLPNGVEAIRLAAAAHTVAASRPPTALLYTRFVEVTPARIVRTWARVIQELPAARLVVVGDAAPPAAATDERSGPAAALRTLARGAGLSDTLIVLGWTPAAALPGLLAAADVAWAPLADTALDRARCPVKLVELLAAGLPIVADDVGEAGRYISAGRHGLLVAPGAGDATAQALLHMLRNPAQARCLGQAAAQRIANEFLWDTLAARLPLSGGQAA